MYIFVPAPGERRELYGLVLVSCERRICTYSTYSYGEREIFAVHILYLYQLTGGEGSEHICTSFRGEREVLLYILVPAYGEREIRTFLYQLLMR